MTTVSPDRLLESSAYVKGALTTSKRLALLRLSQLWQQVDPGDVRGSLDPLLPKVAELMHEQQAAGRQIAWTQAELSAAVATGQEPGGLSLPLSGDRDGRLRGGPSFETALRRVIPGALARIKRGVQPDLAVSESGRMVALQLGSIAHDEARMVTSDVVMAQGSGGAPRMGYARRAEGAHTCDFCRTLATRGPVYRADTAGFRAHRFCDCTTYAVPMESFEVDPKDWAAYQRWASRSVRQSVQTARGAPAFDSISRLDQVNAQIASYEPIVETGNGTEWMRTKLDELRLERNTLLAQGDAGFTPPPGLQRMDPATIDVNYVRSHPFLSTEIPDLPEGTPFSNPERRLARKLAAHHYYYDPNERVGVVVSARHKIKPEHLKAFNETALRAVRQARPDLIDPQAVIVFDLEHPVAAGAMAETWTGGTRIEVSRKILGWSDPAIAARAAARGPYGPHYSISETMGASVEATLLHELGHCNDASFLGRIGDELTPWHQRKVDLYHKWVFTGFADDKDTIHAIKEFAVYGGQSEHMRYLNAIEDGPTLYGRKSPAEMYAEAYAAWRVRDRVRLPKETLEWAADYARAFRWE